MSREGAKQSLLPPLWVLVGVLLCLSIWLLIALKEIVTLVVIGFSIAYVIEPALSYLERKSLPRTLGVLVLIVFFIIFVFLLALTAVPTVVREFGEFSENFPRYMATVKTKLPLVVERIESYVPADALPESPIDTVTTVAGGGALKKLAPALRKALLEGYSFTMALVNLALLPFIVFYFAVDFPNLKVKFLSLFPVIERSRVSRIIEEIDGYVSAFVRGQILVCTILFVLYALGLATVGVELWLLLAVVAGFGNMIPYLGFLVGIILTTIMALVTFGDFTHVLAAWGVFAVVQFLEGTFITPRILGNKVGLSPLVVILALLVGGKLFGLLGIFLAIPGAAILRVLATHFRDWMLRRL